jgi:hypothetical protein
MELIALHRTDEDVVCPEEPSELGIHRAATIEVGAHGDDDAGAVPAVLARRGERVGEGRALGRVVAERERLLELVHGHEHAAGRVGPGGGRFQGPHWMLAGAQQDDRPTLAARQHARRECGQQSGAKRG